MGFDLKDLTELYTRSDSVGLGRMAKRAKEARYGRKAFYVLNQKIEPTNICVLSCEFCDFEKKRGQPGAYEMTIEEILAKCPPDVREIHVTGAMPPEWGFERYVGIVRALRRAYPQAGIKAYTAVEIEWMSRLSQKSVREVLQVLKEAGLTCLPGGGAEVFSERVRRQLFPFKIGAQGWLDIHRTAHRLGIPTNATLLYGHIETLEERWRHLEMLRGLQEETGGFMSFIPLAFQPGKTGIIPRSQSVSVAPEMCNPGPTVPPMASGIFDDLKMIALSRLYLDNFPHIKAYWVSLGEETASLGLHWGADDIDGTVGGERIMHDAGAQSPAQLARERLEDLIREAGCEPVERDTLYNEIGSENNNDVIASPPRRIGGRGNLVVNNEIASSPSAPRNDVQSMPRRPLADAGAVR